MAAPHRPVKRLRRSIRLLWRDRRGATAVEYGLILAIIVIALIVGLMQLAQTTSGMWNDVNDKVTKAH